MPTDRQHLFVASYLAKSNKTSAAIAAGYSRKCAASQGHRLMKDPWVIEQIAKGQTRLAKKLEITAEAVLQELAAIGFANIADFIDPPGCIRFKDLDRTKTAAVSEFIVDILRNDVVRTRIKLHDKRAALVDLARHLGLFKPAPLTPFEGPEEGADRETVPIRDDARTLLFALGIAMKAKADKDTDANAN